MTMYTNTTRVNGNLVFLDDDAHDGNLEKWVDAIGRGVVKDIQHFVKYVAVEWTSSAAGSSTVDRLDGQGGLLRIDADDGDDEGLQLQRKAKCFKLTTDDPLYFGCRWKVDDRHQSDIIVGLCVLDTSLIVGMTDGVYFRKADGDTDCALVTEKDSTETSTSSAVTMTDDTYIVTEFYWNGAASASVTSITRSDTTATVTQAAHGYTTGFSVTIAGANQADYNGAYTVTVVDVDSYTYTVAGSPATPATGTITATASLVRGYINGVLKATHSTNIPDDEDLALSMAYLQGEAEADEGMTIDWISCIQCLKVE